ncbi:MAG: sigma-70 family RNA polymerase sigma factor [Clostridia bacterium]|nr:sigma-70 family RNA polymerase sigma factor [Clostridia bacterium]
MSNGESVYRRFLDGDTEAFDEIWKTYRDSLTFFIQRYVSDFGAAEDIAIDVFTYILVHPQRYNFKVSLKTYIFMLGRSRALDLLRHRKALIMTELSEADGVADALSVEETVLRAEDRRQLNRALEQLPQDMRIAVHLVYFEELSYEETARVMKKNKKQIDNLLYRAKKSLREILERGKNCETE